MLVTIKLGQWENHQDMYHHRALPYVLSVEVMRNGGFQQIQQYPNLLQLVQCYLLTAEKKLVKQTGFLFIYYFLLTGTKPK